MFTDLFDRYSIPKEKLAVFLLLNTHKNVNCFFQVNELLELFYRKILYMVDKHVIIPQPLKKEKEYSNSLERSDGYMREEN